MEFGKQVVESKIDKSLVYNVLAEGIYFLDKSSPSNFNYFGLSTACMKLSKFLMWLLKLGVSVKLS